MKKYLVIVFILILLNLVFTEEKSQAEKIMTTPAGLPGMRGVPSNIPDISVVGDFYIKFSNNENDTERNRLTIKGVELALQGYIYPEMRADVFLAMHRHAEHMETEICEAKVSFLKIFNNLTAEIGKIHVNFGKINKIHQHHRPYVDQPQVIKNFFSEHGLVGEGVCLSYLFPLPFFAQFDVGIWRVPLRHHHEETEESENEFGFADEVYTSKLWLSFPIKEISELELGLNGAVGKGSHYIHHKDEVKVVGVDLTYKLWPAAHTRFVFQNELFYLIRNIPLGDIKRFGFYSYLGYKFNKYWSAGIRYDDTEDVFPHLDETGKENVSLSERTRDVSVILTKNLTETTSLRAQYKYYFEGPKDVHEGYLQVIFGIGSHSHMLE